MTTEWVQTTPDMMHRIALREDQSGTDIRALIGEQHAEILAKSSRTLLMDGEPVAAIGLIDYKTPTVGEDDMGWAWACLSEVAVGHPVALARGTKRWLNEGMRMFGYGMVLAQIRADLPYLRRWIEFMGFEPLEYLEKGMMDGTDAVLFGRFADGGN